MTDEEYAALQADVASRNEQLAILREDKDSRAAELEEVRDEIRALQKETDPLEVKLREETSRRAGTTSTDTIGLGG